MSDAAGNLTDSYAYDAYGMVLNQTGATANPYLYRGEQYDADLSAYDLRARYSQPATGRFLTTDPFQGVPTTPMSLHRYLYGSANPVNFIDPTGRFSLSETMIAGTIISLNVTAFSSHHIKWLQKTYASLGENLFPDAYIFGLTGEITTTVTSALSDILGISITPLSGAIECLLSVSSSQTVIYQVKGSSGGGGNVGNAPLIDTGSSLYEGVVYNLWNAQDYEGPFVGFSMGDYSIACSPKTGFSGAWGATKTVWPSSNSFMIKPSLTTYEIIGEPFNGLSELDIVPLISQTSWLISLIGSLHDPTSLPAIQSLLMDFVFRTTFWIQTGTAKYHWNRQTGYDVATRQQTRIRPDKDKFHGPDNPFPLVLFSLGVLR